MDEGWGLGAPGEAGRASALYKLSGTLARQEQELSGSWFRELVSVASRPSHLHHRLASPAGPPAPSAVPSPEEKRASTASPPEAKPNSSWAPSSRQDPSNP